MNINDLNLDSFQMVKNIEDGTTRLFGFSDTHGGYALDVKYVNATGDIIYCKLENDMITSLDELPKFMINSNISYSIAMGEDFTPSEQERNPFGNLGNPFDPDDNPFSPNIGTKGR